MNNQAIKEQAITFSNRVCKHPAYLKAFQAVEQLERYRGVKPKGLLVRGKTGTGKSFLAEQIIKNRQNVDTDCLSTHPVLYINIAEGSKTVGAVVSTLLSELNAPTPFKGTIAKRMLELNTLMQNMNVELVILDEIHDWIPESGVTPKSEIYLFFKSCLNKWKIPFLFLGTDEAEQVFVDKQLKDRCLPDQTLSVFTCNGVKSMTNFGMLLSSLLDKFPRKTKGMNFIKKTENVKDKRKPTFSLIKANRSLLLRICLATQGQMRLLSDLLTDCIYQTKEDEVVNIKVLKKAFDSVVKDKPHGNPFNELINIRSVIKALKKEELYAK
jgi:DNA replication protein DnaC